MARLHFEHPWLALAWTFASLCATVSAGDAVPEEYLQRHRNSHSDSDHALRIRSDSVSANPLVSRSFGILLGRQLSTGCSSSSEYACSNGGCCPIGRTCYPDSCCLPGEQQCAVSFCFDPLTEVCCASEGTTCDIGYDCVADNSCCKTGRIPCGADYCYDQSSEVCCADGSICDKGTSCGSSSCIGGPNSNGGGFGGGLSSDIASSATGTRSFSLTRATSTSSTSAADEESTTTTRTRTTTTARTTTTQAPEVTSSTTTGAASRHGSAPWAAQVADYLLVGLIAVGLL